MVGDARDLSGADARRRRGTAARLAVLAASLCAVAVAIAMAGGGGERAAPAGAVAEGRDAERSVMVRDQLQRRDIDDPRVLDAMRAVPRHRFVGRELQEYAYADTPLPIGRGQTISQPYIVAFMAQALRLRGGERVLEVGSGSGYAAAVLSRLAAEVYGIELERDLYDRSVVTLDALGYPNVHLRCGDGFGGWPEQGPFDAILVSCAAEEVPAPLWEQLAEGGRIVYPKGSADDVQELVRVTKVQGRAREERLVPVRFVPMRRGR